ncbi:hypothetical protein BKA83DRAFT_4340362, partial [Pisolithus microcarpus]
TVPRPRGRGVLPSSSQNLSYPYRVRFLGQLLRLAPAGNGQSQVQRDIASAVDNVELLNLDGNYLNLFIHACESQTVHYLGINPSLTTLLVRSQSSVAVDGRLSRLSTLLARFRLKTLVDIAWLYESALDHRTARAAVLSHGYGYSTDHS